MSNDRQAQQRRYQQRYRQTPKGKATARRYERTAKGKAVRARFNRKRLFVGERYVGTVPSQATADAINAHIKERLSAFKQGQSAGAEMEALAPDAIPL